jgi:hypothetical protein
LTEIIRELKFKNPSRILKIFKKETVQLSVASVPGIISTMKRHSIIYTKKGKKVYMRFSWLLNLLHTMYKKLEDI